MDFKSYLNISASEINQEMDQFLDGWSREVLKTSPKISHLNKHFIDACLGGKRLRGTLVKLGYEIARSRNHLGGVMASQAQPATIRGDLLLKEILKPAVAFEIFQTAILAHDDIIDLSPLRRGKPTIYQALGGNHYGISQTICLGDIGFFLAYKIISESDFPEKLKNLAVASFSNSMLDTGIGEMLDVELSTLSQKGSVSDILTIFHLKTAMYTITGPLSLGAILGGADEKLLKNIADFGHNLGIAFQIQDDILGVFGSEEVIGKSVTSDIEEGKLTLLYLYASKNGGEEGLKGIYGSKVGKEELEKVRKIFVETGALKYSQKKAEELVTEAKKIIPLITTNREQRTILSEMSDFLVKRDK